MSAYVRYWQIEAPLPIEYRRHVVGIDADHVAHHHAGHGGYVVVRAVDHYGHAGGYAAV